MSLKQVWEFINISAAVSFAPIKVEWKAEDDIDSPLSFFSQSSMATETSIALNQNDFLHFVKTLLQKGAIAFLASPPSVT